VATIKYPKPKADFNQIAEELSYNEKSVGQIQRSIAALRQDKDITHVPEWAIATAGKPFDVRPIDRK
jgi:hypothetical protein